jgi:hypothetical protein
LSTDNDRAGDRWEEPIASCFISYNHVDKPLAQALRDGLEARGYRVWIDEGELRVGDSLVAAISAAIDQVDFLIALVSEASAASRWCQKEISLAMTGEIARRGVTVLPCRVRNVAMPATLIDKLYLSVDPADVDAAIETLDKDMKRHLQPNRPLPPRRRSVAQATSSTASTATSRRRGRSAPSTAAFDPRVPIKMTGIDVDGMTAPRNDGTPGSALYMVPVMLDVAPDATWAEVFRRPWDRPPRWTSMHRPGIASVSGKRIRLDGTTVEEVERYHLETLKLALEETNRERLAIAEREDTRARRAQEEREAQERQAREVASRLRFD